MKDSVYNECNMLNNVNIMFTTLNKTFLAFRKFLHGKSYNEING